MAEVTPTDVRDPNIATDINSPVLSDPAPVKPGWKTSELYLTVLALGGAIGTLFRIPLEPDQIESLGLIVVILAPAVAVVWKYISERGKTKRAAIDANVHMVKYQLTNKE